MEKITKKYTNGEITVVWKPALCVHAAVCFTELPEVFVPYERPWIKMNGASTEEIMDTVSRCPTRAISYYRNDGGSSDRKEEATTEIKILKNGPYIVKGAFKVIDVDCNEIVTEKTISLCRCGVTKKKPFCDGSHSCINFNIDDEYEKK